MDLCFQETVVIVGINSTLESFSAAAEAFICTEQTPFSNALLFPEAAAPVVGSCCSSAAGDQNKSNIRQEKWPLCSPGVIRV